MHTRYLQAKFSSRPKGADQLSGPRSLLIKGTGFLPGVGGKGVESGGKVAEA